MTSKLSLHLQAHPNWADDGGSAARWIKVMDPPGANRWPGKQIIGRVYMPDHESNDLVRQGAAGAEAWFRFCQPAFGRAPYIRIWEAPNEPQPVADIGFCRQLAAFTIRLAELMHGAGLQLVGGNLSEGNPGGDEAQRRAFFVEIARGLAVCDFWSQHCYWVLDYSHPEAGMNDWHAFRYRMNVRYAAEARITLPPLLITECGVDGGVVAMPKRGWKTFCPDRQAYMQQLAAFDTELAKDSYVLTAVIFTAGPAGWEDFDVDAQLNDMINAHIQAQGGPFAGTGTGPGSGMVPERPLMDALLRQEFGADYLDLTQSLARHSAQSYTTRALQEIDRIVLHHTATPRGTSWQRVAEYHVNANKWPGIGYHIGIRLYGGAVTVALLNDPRTRSYHARTIGNDRGLAVCVMGDFEKNAVQPKEQAALRRVVQVVRRWATWAATLPVIGHCDVPGNQTSCPGTALRALLPTLNETDTLRAALLAEATRCQVIQLNRDAALQRRIFADAFVPTSPEFELQHSGVRYVGQRAERLDTGEVRVYYACHGEWDHVAFVRRPSCL